MIMAASYTLKNGAFELYFTPFSVLSEYKNVRVLELREILRATEIVERHGKQYGPIEKEYSKYLLDGNSIFINENPIVDVSKVDITFKNGWMMKVASEKPEGLERLLKRLEIDGKVRLDAMNAAP